MISTFKNNGIFYLFSIDEGYSTIMISADAPLEDSRLILNIKRNILYKLSPVIQWESYESGGCDLIPANVVNAANLFVKTIQ